MQSMAAILLVGGALIAFAGNSILCRLALGDTLIDPVSFTTIRLISGAVALLLLARLRIEPPSPAPTQGSWGSGGALFVYAVAFSLAYVSLSAGMGALILFASVQVTMLVVAIQSGERLSMIQWAGTIVAIGGLIYLMLPGITAPNPLGALLMGVAGIAWGVYSLRGRSVVAPIRMTAENFLRASPFAVLTSVVIFSGVRLETAGLLLALISGVGTSGLGYVIWYAALRALTTTQAALIQLVVPVLAAFGGIVLLSEPVSMRLLTASSLILGGVAIATLTQSGQVGRRTSHA